MAVCVVNIWEEFNAPLKNFIKKRTENEQDAEDILQDVFYKIHSGISTLKDDTKIHAWIYRITRNSIADFYRKNRAFELAQFTEDIESKADEDFTSNVEIAACLKAMIDSLPEKYRQAILLTEFQNLTQKELSERMGLSLSGAKSRVQRGREKLKGILLGCCHFEFDRMGNIIDYRHKSSKCKYC